MNRFICVFACLFTVIFGVDDGLDLKESTIPVVDLQKYFDPETRDQFIEDVRNGFHNVGFIGVKNTKVNQVILDDVYSALVRFFAFSVEEKMKISAELFDGQRGYTRFAGEVAKGVKVGDVKEYITVGRDMSDEDLVKYDVYKNQWPDFMDFKTPAMNFYNHIEGYAVLFQEIFSLALHQEKDFLKEKCENGDSSFRMIYYPNKESEEGAIWAKAHTDINCFTILPRSTAAGLEVMNANGEWVPVFVKEDAFIINVGDFLEAYSNGYFKSSKHRVIKPKGCDRKRYSCVLFVHPRSESIIEPLDVWVEKTGGKPKFIKATRWELFMERMADNRQATDEMLKELGQSDVMERLMTVDRASKDAMEALVEAGYASEAVKDKLNELNKK